jgi:hypothetical protein
MAGRALCALCTEPAAATALVSGPSAPLIRLSASLIRLSASLISLIASLISPIASLISLVEALYEYVRRRFAMLIAMLIAC